MTSPAMMPRPTFVTLFAAGVARLCRPVRQHVRRPPHWQAMAGWLVVAAFIVALVHFVDLSVSRQLRGLPALSVAFFEAITDIGLAGVTLWPTGIGILGGLALLTRSRRPWTFPSRLLGAAVLRLSFIFVAVAGSGLIVTAVKRVFGRERPWANPLDPTAFEFFTLKSQFVSFPSGHATAIAGGALALALLFPRARGALAALALLVCISRIVVGAHFPADVVAGAVFGSAFTLGTWRWFARRALIFPASSGFSPTVSTAHLVSRLVSGVRKRR